MSRVHDISGMTFGKLLVIEPTDKRTSQGAILWKVRCQCGKEKEMAAYNLLHGDMKSCGSGLCRDGISSHSVDDLTGRTFGNLFVVGPSEMTGKGSSTGKMWQCSCSCGRQKIVMGKHLKRGLITSCGKHKKHEWNGTSFRSHWEVFIAIYLDCVGVEWQYETKKIALEIDGESKTYIPDFWLPESDSYIEIKGRISYGVKRHRDAMRKPTEAISMGYNISIMHQTDIEDMTGCRLGDLYRARANGGYDAVIDMIRHGIRR